MWTTTMQFLHTPTASSAINSGSSNNTPSNLLATGTAYKQVQIYDIRQSSSTVSRRRPVLYTPEKLLSHRITTLCQLPDGNTLAVGDSSGDCHLLDMRKMHSGHANNKSNKKAKEEIGLGRLVGPGGSIRQLAMHPTLPYLACVGLDRKLWTWDVSRRKMVDCVYLRQRLNCVLFCEDGSWDMMEGDDDEDDEMVQEDEDGVEIGEGGIKRERALEKVEDEVEDYVDSEDDDDDDDVGEGKDGTANSEETVSDSDEEEDGDDSDEDEEESGDEESTSSEEEEPTTNTSSANPKKKRRK
mmetsp:Transcript_40706/g.66820  ORF Transcript_40706/g.66820 Transcript_40706/m.66820 type:complete len:298 (+) Transcript_40706:103-996(+)